MNKIICQIHSKGHINWIHNNGSGFNRHNNNGPAVLWIDGYKHWVVNNKLHRLDGPACENVSGTKEWYINDVRYNTEFEYWIAVQNYNNTHE